MRFFFFIFFWCVSPPPSPFIFHFLNFKCLIQGMNKKNAKKKRWNNFWINLPWSMNMNDGEDEQTIQTESRERKRKQKKKNLVCPMINMVKQYCLSLEYEKSLCFLSFFFFGIFLFHHCYFVFMYIYSDLEH